MTFATDTALRHNAPAYFVTIDGISDREYSTHKIKGAILTKVICMQIPSGATQALTPLQGRATVGEIAIPMVDVDGEMTRLISTEAGTPVLATLINRRMTLWAGYRGLDESDYIQVFTGEIRKVRNSESLVYEFILSDFKRRYEDRIMADLEKEPTTKLVAPTFTSGTLLQVSSVDGFAASDSILLHKKDGSAGENRTIDSVDENNKWLVLTSGVGTDWFDGDVVTKGARVAGNIVNVFYSILTGTFSTDPTDPYPLRATHGTLSGLSLVDSDLDLTLFTKTRDNFLANFDVDFVFTDPIVGRSFFEREIFPLGFYPTVQGDGKLGIRAFVPPGPEITTPDTIAESNMEGFPVWRRQFKTHINRINIFGDKDLGGTEDTLLALSEDTTDQTNTKEIGEYEITSRGLRSGLDGVALAKEVANRILRRWLVPPIEMTVVTEFTKRQFAMGDIVSISHPSLPDTVNNSVGLTDKLMEIVRVNPLFPEGKMSFELMETGFKRFAWMGPASMPSFGSATDAQKRYAYFGDSNNKVNGGIEDGYFTY